MTGVAVRRILAELAIAGVLVGCGSSAASIGPASIDAPTTAAATGQPATAAPIPTRAPTPTPASNVVTPAPTVAASPDASKFREYVRACSDYGYVRYTVIFAIRNTGNTWIRLVPFESDYTIMDEGGQVTDTGSFLYSYPTYLAPGEIGYMIDDSITDGGKVKDYAKAEMTGQFEEVDESEAIVLKVSKVAIKKDSDGHYATGLVTNTSSEAIDSAHAAAIFLNSKGEAIGASTTNLIENLEAGKAKGFKTLSGSCDPKWSSVAKTVVLVGGDSY